MLTILILIYWTNSVSLNKLNVFLVHIQIIACQKYKIVVVNGFFFWMPPRWKISRQMWNHGFLVKPSRGTNTQTPLLLFHLLGESLSKDCRKREKIFIGVKRFLLHQHTDCIFTFQIDIFEQQFRSISKIDFMERYLSEVNNQKPNRDVAAIGPGSTFSFSKWKTKTCLWFVSLTHRKSIWSSSSSAPSTTRRWQRPLLAWRTTRGPSTPSTYTNRSAAARAKRKKTSKSDHQIVVSTLLFLSFLPSFLSCRAAPEWVHPERQQEFQVHSHRVPRGEEGK